MNQTVKILAAVVVVGTIGAVSVVLIGLYNVSARSGHWPGVETVFHATYESSVRLRAPDASDVPDLSDPDLVALGAKHFDAACAFCHGAPGGARTATSEAMAPSPPHIQTAISEWEPQHLFWIVGEGVKMTGMPYWPSTRKDEVWAVVAFLERARDMDADAYRRLIAPPSPREAGQGAQEDETLAFCATCHGFDGVSGNRLIPRLDIQSETYLRQALTAYRAGRESGFMRHAVTSVPAEELFRMAAHFGALEPVNDLPPPPPASEDATDPQAGAALAASGTDAIPACAACHGPDAPKTTPETPRLAGLSEAYIAAQLKLWRDGAHGPGGPRADLMAKAARALEDGDIAALARYYGTLPPE